MKNQSQKTTKQKIHEPQESSLQMRTLSDEELMFIMGGCADLAVEIIDFEL